MLKRTRRRAGSLVGELGAWKRAERVESACLSRDPRRFTIFVAEALVREAARTLLVALQKDGLLWHAPTHAQHTHTHTQTTHTIARHTHTICAIHNTQNIHTTRTQHVHTHTDNTPIKHTDTHSAHTHTQRADTQNTEHTAYTQNKQTTQTKQSARTEPIAKLLNQKDLLM